MPHPADIVDQLAQAASTLATDMRLPSRSVNEADRRIAEGERIAAALRAVVRGGSGR